MSWGESGALIAETIAIDAPSLDADVSSAAASVARADTFFGLRLRQTMRNGATTLDYRTLFRCREVRRTESAKADVPFYLHLAAKLHSWKAG
jgi:hypothetical protein